MRKLEIRYLFISLLVLLVLRLSLYFIFQPTFKPGQEVSVVTPVETQPSTGWGGQQFQTESFRVSAPLKPELHYGDRVRLDGVIDEFGKLKALKIEIVEKFVPNFWQSLALGIRQQFLSTYENVLPRRQASLLSGVVLGNVGLDRRFKSQLADVGLTHVVAASGMNIALFSGGVFWVLALLRVRKIYKVILSMGFILLYSTVTGFEPPIVRAALMVGFTSLAMVFGRQSNGLMGLLLAAYLMLLVSPKLLVNASFLLSFTAMMGQIFLSSFSPRLPREQTLLADFWAGIKNNFWQSFLAVLFTFPIVLWFFAKFSLVSLLSNVLVLWTIEPLMILGAVLGLLGSFGGFVALSASPLLAYFLWVVDFLSGKDYFLFNFNLVSPIFVVGYYLTLGGFVWWWSLGRKMVK